MQDLARGAALAYNASMVLRIGSAVFVACPDDRLQSLYYRVDGGVRSVWRHLRGSTIDPRLMQEAQEANRKLWEQAPAFPLPQDFLVGYRDLAALALAYLDRDEAVSRDEMSARAIETVGFLEAGLGSAAGAVDFERSCQAATELLLQGWAEDPMATMRRVRSESGVWALAYQRFVRPELGLGHGVSG
ncbi:hypothetical protein [Actinacidiphila glaucinigra]|uniref:Uncharacterized protein n=1 Tax=Actinacidiphila glaucinigra TaxID=235986 RepID=A0A239KLC9_9ACTN|nr:hypothetical protein [Actinacidiphila glaucinigra]SNT18875.1 hypothetical protein SAMN05216252_11626 [Actinacidiphila glaucinigra]